MLTPYFTTVRYLDLLPAPSLILALLTSVLIVIASSGFHEAAHWIVGKCFGAPGRLRFFPNRGVSKLWFISTMGITYPDNAAAAVSVWQFRLMAAAGPAWDLFFGIVCVFFYADLPFPALARDALACAGVTLIPVTLVMNITPLPFGNDGWKFLYASRFVGACRRP